VENKNSRIEANGPQHFPLGNNRKQVNSSSLKINFNLYVIQSIAYSIMSFESWNLDAVVFVRGSIDFSSSVKKR